MTAQSFSTGNTTLSPFSSISGADYVSRYIPFNDQKSPASGAFPATGTPGFAIGAGLLGTAVTIATATASSPSAGFVTYTTSGAHGLVANQQVTISGISSPLGYNGTFKIVSVGSTTTFTVANSTTGSFIGSGTIAASSVRSDGLYYRPIMFYSISMPFTAASSTVQLQFATAASGSGGNQGPSQGDAATVTWDNTNTTEFLNYAVSQCTTADAAVTYYVGFEKQDANTTTFRRGATSSSSIAPNGIYANGVLQDGTGGTSDWSGTALRCTVSWRHIPNHPTALTATTGTNPGEINLSWTAPSDNGGSAVYGYRIAYKKTGDSTWYVYGTNTYMSPSNTTSTSEVIEGLEPGAEYSFVVAALNEVTDRYNGGVAYPDRTYASYTSTTDHAGQNSNISIATAQVANTVTDPKFGAYDQSLSRFVAATPKVQGASGIVNGVPWVFDGTKWTRSLQVSGGTKSTYTSGGITYTLHTFSTSDNLYVKECQGGLNIDYLVVGGGGGGGGRYNAGGGGAGGVLSGTMTLSSNTLYPVIVGIGGTGGAATDKGLNGKDSSFNGIVAKGGGGGGAFQYASGGDAQGLSGGSGGGNSGYTTGTGAPTGPGLGTSGQGSNGGLGALYGGGGGGGAGGAGANGTTTTGGAGGVGVSNSITGSAVFYGGGGGGASYTSTTVPQGGNGGGGNGAPGPNTTAGGVPTAGTDGRGGGGGGANGYGTTGATTVGGDGGDGIVIIRYISSIV